MKISNVFVGQRSAKNEPLEWVINDHSLTGAPNGNKVEFDFLNTPNVADQEYWGGGTHGSYVLDGNFYFNKAGVFAVDLDVRIGPPFGVAALDGTYQAVAWLNDGSSNKSFYTGEFEVETTADNNDRWRNIQVQTFTPFMKKTDYIYFVISALSGAGASDRERLTFRAREVARIIK